MVFKTKREYSWNIDKYNTSAEKVGGVIENIENRDGYVTKQSFLDESRPEEAPTHEMFEWNDKVAAEKYRLGQSGEILRNIVVTVQREESQEPKTVRAVVSVEPERHSTAHYISVERALESTTTRQIVLQHALTELKEIERKYEDLRELSGVFNEIEKVDEETQPEYKERADHSIKRRIRHYAGSDKAHLEPALQA